MSATPSPFSPGILFGMLAAGLLFAAGIVGFAASDAVVPVSAELAAFLKANWIWLIGAGVILDAFAMLALLRRKRAATYPSDIR